MKIRASLLTIVLFSFIFSGCATTSTSQNNLSTPDNKYSYDGKLSQDQKHLKNHNFIDDITYSKYMSKRDMTINNELFSFYNEWKGTKYRMGGYTKKGIDCSGFVQKAILEKFDLIHYSTQIQRLCHIIFHPENGQYYFVTDKVML